jgi:hypothetical protein
MLGPRRLQVPEHRPAYNADIEVNLVEKAAAASGS